MWSAFAALVSGDVGGAVAIGTDAVIGGGCDHWWSWSIFCLM